MLGCLIYNLTYILNTCVCKGKIYETISPVIDGFIFIFCFQSIAPAIRIGWTIASEKVIEQLADIRMQIDYGSSILSQMVVYELLKSGDYDRHVAKLRHVLKEKRDYMLSMLNERFSELAEWEAPEGGFFIWVNFNEKINVKKLFSELIDKEKILINPGFIYGSEENTIRLSYAFESRENIKYALENTYQYACV